MSKSSKAIIEKAVSIIAKSGITVNLSGYVEDAKGRKHNKKFLWRNADLVACLVVNSAANAFQTETMEELAENGFDSMSQAIDAYISSNIDTWSQADWEQNSDLCDSVAQLDRLVSMVTRWNEYHAKNNWTLAA